MLPLLPLTGAWTSVLGFFSSFLELSAGARLFLVGILKMSIPGGSMPSALGGFARCANALAKFCDACEPFRFQATACAATMPSVERIAALQVSCGLILICHVHESAQAYVKSAGADPFLFPGSRSTQTTI